MRFRRIVPSPAKLLKVVMVLASERENPLNPRAGCWHTTIVGYQWRAIVACNVVESTVEMWVLLLARTPKGAHIHIRVAQAALPRRPIWGKVDGREDLIMR